jgi:hypothetical protein
MNGDGLVDIAVANSTSASISLLLNQGNRRFGGQFSLSVAGHPRSVTAPDPTGGGDRTLVITHPSEDKISVVSWSDAPLRASSFSVPTGTQPYVLSARRDSGIVRVFVRYPQRPGAVVTLSRFDQISGGQFLERSLRTSLPDRISALTVDRAGTPHQDIALIGVERNAGRAFLSTASMESDFTIGPLRQNLAFRDSTASVRALIPAGLTSATSRDFIIVFGPPVNALGIAYRTHDGSFRDSLEWIADVHIREEDDLVVEDVDRDGRPDITVRNDAAKTVSTMYGGANGFAPAVSICSARGVRSIAIAPLVVPGQSDLIMSRPADGTVAILFAPFRHHR